MAQLRRKGDMMSVSPSIKVKVNVDGVQEAVTGLRRLRGAALIGSAAMGRIGSGLGDDLKRMGSLVASVGGLGAAIGGVGLGLGAFAGLHQALKQSEELAISVTAEIDRLDQVAQGIGAIDAVSAGALAYAGAREGLSGNTADIEKIMGRLHEQLRGYLDDEKKAHALLNKMGAEEELFFDINTGKLLDAENIVLNFSEIIRSMNEQGRDSGAILEEIFGTKQVANISRFFGVGGDAISEYLNEYRTLTQFEKEDVAKSRDLQDSMTRRAAAVWGLQNTFTQALIPAMIESNAQWTAFFTSNHDEVELLGKEMGEVKTIFSDVSLAAAEIAMKLIAGESVTDSPLATIVRTLLELVKQTAVGAKELSNYFMTGERPSTGWVAGALDAFELLGSILKTTYDVAKSVADFIIQDVAPKLEVVTAWIDKLLTSIGVGESGDQIALVLTMIAFKSTLVSVVKVIASMIAGLGALQVGAVSTIGGIATAALSAAAAIAGIGAMIGGAGIVINSAEEMNAEMALVTRDAKKLAETEGEAYAAAYVAAFIDRVPKEYRGASLGNWLASGVDGLFGTDIAPDYETAQIQLEYIAAQGTEDEVVRGLAAAYAKYGWNVDQSGMMRVDAGISVSGVEFQEKVLQEAQHIDGIIDINEVVQVDNLMSRLTEELGQIEMPSIGIDTSALESLFSIEAPPAAATLAPVSIYIEGMSAPLEVYGSQDQIQAIRTGVSQSVRARS